MKDILRYVPHMGWIVGGTCYNGIWSAYHILEPDSISLIESILGDDFLDKWVTIEYTITDEGKCKLVKILDKLTDEETWDNIEEEYARDQYPPFGGPFTDALKPFEWLKLNYKPPKLKN